MPRKVWSVVIDSDTIEKIETKFEEVKKYGKNKKYTKTYLGYMIEALLSKENLDKLIMEDCFKK